MEQRILEIDQQGAEEDKVNQIAQRKAVKNLLEEEYQSEIQKKLREKQEMVKNIVF